MAREAEEDVAQLGDAQHLAAEEDGAACILIERDATFAKSGVEPLGVRRGLADEGFSRGRTPEYVTRNSLRTPVGVVDLEEAGLFDHVIGATAHVRNVPPGRAANADALSGICRCATACRR